MNINKAYDTIKKWINEDPEYAWAWHCNIAMPMQDEGCSYDLANRGTARVMSMLFGVDTSKNKNYRIDS